MMMPYSAGFPWLMMWVLILITGGATLYYAAIISGLYKDTLLATFRAYGEEQRYYPLFRFFVAAGTCCVLVALMLRNLAANTSYFQTSLAPLSFGVLALMSFVAAFLVRRAPTLREALPRWYAYLLNEASRQERRFIGFAWLKIPPKMRWRLNGDQQAFMVWADMVRITVIYGAYDPDNPWRMWG
jgi:hypothetical protein